MQNSTIKLDLVKIYNAVVLNNQYKNEDIDEEVENNFDFLLKDNKVMG